MPDSRPRDSGFNSIGNLLSTPYDADDSDGDEELFTPNASARTPTPATAPSSAKGYKGILEVKMRSLSHDDVEGEEDDDESTIRFKPHTPIKGAGVSGVISTNNSPSSRQSMESGRVRPPTIVEFPGPSLQPAQGHGFGYPNVHQRPLKGDPLACTRANANRPNEESRIEDSPRTPPRIKSSTTRYPPLPPNLPSRSSHHLSPHRPDQAPTFLLPPPSSPISPLLAAPPKSHISPLSPPFSPFATASRDSGHSRDSSITSESIRAYDIMAEKKAFFREGHEELMSSFSPFVSVKLYEAQRKESGDSAWLAQAQEARGRIKWIILAVLISTLAIVGGLAAYSVTRPSSSSSSHAIVRS
ncbi:hypothetical protein IAR55_005939 [Kwoniella newhampshirensis]|uniref:Uncharacterized protein n=1 Tax=Kwoniella newhampshirensis TaxID=1651941 RepID=A0AAW0YV61_9TREE